MDQALNSQKTPHTSPLRASYGMSFVSILMKNDRVIKGFYCIGPRYNGSRLYRGGFSAHAAHNEGRIGAALPLMGLLPDT